MTSEEIRQKLQLNILKLGLIEKQINRATPIDHPHINVEDLKQKQKTIIENNNNYLLQLELLNE